MTNEADVIIVGAGPTGLSLACQLIRFGIDFIIIDKNDGPTPYSKALGVHARTMEIYEQMDLASVALERGAIAKTVRFLEGGQVRGELDFSNIGQGMSPYPFLLVLEQSKNEKLLYDFMRQRKRDVRWGTKLERVTQTSSGVSAFVVDAAGTAGELHGKYIVGCDGAKSQVRHELGLTFAGSTYERIFYVADVEMEWPMSHDALHICLAKDAFILFFPMKGDRRYRIVGVLPEGATEETGQALYDEIEQHVRGRSELLLDITAVNWFSSYKVHTRRVDRFSNGRGFVAGDAAHVHSPAGAQGMNTGIQDAYNLAWKLAYVLKNAASPWLLDTYNEERLENAQRLLETTDRMFQLGAGSDWFVSLLRTTVMPHLAGFVLNFESVRKLMFPLISQIGITYRDCQLSDRSGDDEFEVLSGDRMPYLVIEGESLYDRLRAPKFHLVTFSDGRTDHSALSKLVAAGWAQILDHRVVPLYPDIAEKFGSEATFHVLLRPDNHICLVASEADVGGIDAYLKKLQRAA